MSESTTETTPEVVESAEETQPETQVVEEAAVEAAAVEATEVTETEGEDAGAIAEAKAEKLLREVKSLRERKNTLTAQNEELAARIAEAEKQANVLAETQAKAAALEAQLRQIRVEKATNKVFTDLRVADVAAEAALNLMDKNAIEWDEDGNPTNVEEIVKATLERFPILTTTTPRAVIPTGTIAAPARTATTSDEALAQLRGPELLAALAKRRPMARS